MFWLWFILFGFIVGLVARWLVPGAMPGGILADILTGIIGAFIGGWIYRHFGHGQPDLLWSFLYALIGAVVLLLILRAFTGRRSAI